MSEHLSRKELKTDKVRETFQHGAQAVFSHTQFVGVILVVLVLIAGGYFGWKIYSDRQNDQAQAALDDAMRVFNAPIAVPGQPTLPGELTYTDQSLRSQEAETKLAGVASKFPHTNAGKLASYYSALCLMDLDKLNQAGEELKKIDSGSDKELAALAQYQQARIAERNGKNDDAIKILKALSTSGSVLVPKPMVLLEIASVTRQTDPKQAQALYEQIKKDYPNSMVADEADRGLQSISTKS